MSAKQCRKRRGITWTKDNGTSTDDKTRIGQVTLHYIDSNGLEHDLADTVTIDPSELSKTNGQIVDLETTWGKEIKPTDDEAASTTYTYDHAVIGDRRTGDTVTGIKVEKNESGTKKVQTGYTDGQPVYENVTATTYKLYYTDAINPNDANAKWTLYKDSASDSDDNNADIWLIYGVGNNVGRDMVTTYHHVDQYGARLTNDRKQTITVSQRNSSYTQDYNGSGNFSSTGFERAGIVRVSGIGTWQYATYEDFHNAGEANVIYATSTNQYGISYKYDSATGIWHSAVRYVVNRVTHNDEIFADNPHFVSDIYQVYSGYKGTTIHYVDENGNTIAEDSGAATASENTFTAADHTTLPSSVTGYTYKEARINSYNGSAFTTIQYTNTDGTWSSITNNGDASVSDAPALVNEVWLVYTKSPVSKTFTVNYKYSNSSNSGNAYYGSNATNTTQTFSLSSGQVKQLVKDSTQSSGWADIIHDGDVKRAALTGESGAKNLTYVSTRLGSVNGPEISSVEVRDDGSVVYHNSYSFTLIPSEQFPNRYTLHEDNNVLQGRRFVIVKDDDGNLSIEDSQNGTFDLNYANDAGGSGENTFVAAYTSTLHGENLTTEYTVNAINNGYQLSVEESLPSSNLSIYNVYTDASGNDEDKITIKDDLKYSGLLRTDLSDHLTSALKTADENSVSYEWYRIQVSHKTPVDSTTTGTLVTRKQTGDHWNIAADAEDAKYLDVEADEGTDTWTITNDIYYYVQVKYKKDGTEHVVKSEPFEINYYGELENGGFDNTGLSTKGNWDLDSYLNADGVWRTTTLDSNITRHNDVEIVNATADLSNPSGYNWKLTDKETAARNENSKASVAVNGDYFAEINAESAGALYQDVITHPNETLSYGLSHRARGNSGSGNKCDSMYLVIMPTSLAMTSGIDNTELSEQGDINTPGTLTYFINQHGGYDTSTVTSEEDRVTYYDKDRGILIRKISSDRDGWHNISVANGYTAKGGLTRFFFVAGPTASGGATVGNFLDAVYFSQSLPVPEGFNLTVSKTFSGLSQSQLAAMAENNNSSNPFTLTITNSYTQSNTELHNDALQNTKLQFTATQSGANSYTFSAIARQWQHKTGTNTWEVITEEEYNEHVDDTENYREVDLFANNNNNTPNARWNPSDGTLTLSWTFTKQDLPSSALDRTFRYTVAESNGSVSGLTQTATYSLNGGTTQTGTSGTISVHQTETASYDFSNSYRENTGDDSQITVQKVFTGVTQTTVNTLLNSDSPYSITVKKTNAGDGTAIDDANQPTLQLTPSTTGTVAGANVQHSYNVSYSAVEDTNSGKMTLTWTIARPDSDETGADTLMGGPGIYSVSETNFTPTPQQDNGDNNSLTSVKVNGKEVKGDLSASTISESNIYVGLADYSPTLQESSDSNVTKGPIEATSGTLDTSTNLIIAKTSGSTYLVWTSEKAGANTREAILKKINSVFNSAAGSSQASMSNVSFFSGENPGELSYSSIQHSGMTMTYNSTTGALSFANETEAEGSWTWSQYYSTHFTLNDGTGYNPETNNADNKMANNATEISVANSYEPIVRIKKVNSENQDPLNNATFRLFKYQDGEKVYLLTNKTGDNYSWAEEKDVTTANPIRTFTTNGDGDAKGIVSLGRMETANAISKSGGESITYYFEETSAPDGYNKLSKPLAFVVHADGTVERWSTTSGDETVYKGTTSDNVEVDNTCAEIDWNSPYYTVTISNTPGVLLPITGGIGVWPFIFTGFALIMFASYLLWRRRRSKLVEEKLMDEIRR